MSNQKVKTMFRNNDEKKLRKYDTNIHFLILYKKHFTKIIDVLIVYFFKVGQVYPVHPFLSSCCYCYEVSLIYLLWLVVIIHMTMKIPDGNFQAYNKLFVLVHARKACKLKFADHLWSPFHDQPQSDVVVFKIITFQTFKILVREWKHDIDPNDIIAFNNLFSISIIELDIIDFSSHEKSIELVITKTEFSKKRKVVIQNMIWNLI